MQGLDLIDSGAFDLSDWDQRLPPPAAKTAVQTLSVVIISPEQAGDRNVLNSAKCVLEFRFNCKLKTLAFKTRNS